MPTIDHYVVILRNASDTSTVDTHEVDAATLETTFTGLPAGTSYKAKVYSKAGGVLSATPLVLDVSTSSSGGGKPGTPDSISSIVDSESISLEDIVAGEGPEPDHFLVFLMNGAFSQTLEAPREVTIAELPTLFSGLTPETDYGIRVLAIKNGVYSDVPLDTVVTTEAVDDGGDSVAIVPTDDRAAAPFINTPSGEVIFDNSAYTPGSETANFDSGPAGRDAWVKFKLVENSQSVTFSTVGSGYDTTLYVFNAAGSIQASDDDSGGGGTSVLTWSGGIAGNTYYVRISAYSANEGMPGGPSTNGGTANQTHFSWSIPGGVLTA